MPEQQHFVSAAASKNPLPAVKPQELVQVAPQVVKEAPKAASEAVKQAAPSSVPAAPGGNRNDSMHIGSPASVPVYLRASK